jgi:deoxyribodipyrimidine photo-lyase
MLGSGPPQPIPAPTALPGPPDIPGLPIPEAKSADIFPASEAEAHRRLRSFLEGQTPPVFNYFESRNRLDQQGTSCLSPYLRFGLLSPRQAYTTGSQALENAPDGEAKQSVQAWLNQLIWREFFLSILDQFPHVLQRSFRVKLANIHWTNNEVAFEAWCQGRTGFPVVDAAMRQLSQSGWMHNRARMITASFLVKDLLINWQWGERWFMQHLIDGDPANNNGGWQWTAGTGTDAAPYFRIFNPTLQGKKFDPQGDFVQQWIPELAEVPQPYLHEPWKMPIDVQEDASCKIGEDYPAPIVEHAWARERTLKAFDKAQSNSGSK